ncbi:hypothetical protein NL676_003422 [Syzygium grande]|nr:hypothetical protein NL676_003422 [Syzygium grande]
MLGPRFWETMGPPARREHWKLDLKKGCPKSKEGVIDSWDEEAEDEFLVKRVRVKRQKQVRVVGRRRMGGGGGGGPSFQGIRFRADGDETVCFLLSDRSALLDS